MKNIFIIQGHPIKDTFSKHIKEVYQIRSRVYNSEMKIIRFKDLDFVLSNLFE